MEEYSNILGECYKFADKLVTKAVKERDKKGYRENLGYDQHLKLRDYMSGKGLTYLDECSVMDRFYGGCDNI